MGNTVSTTITTPETGSEAPAKVDAPNPADAWRPEGFTGTQEDLAKSWRDQRAEITRLQQGAKKPTAEKPAASALDIPPAAEDEAEPHGEDQTTDPAEGDDKTKKQDDAAEKVVKSAGFDVSTYNDEYATTGDVSPESRQKIAEGLKKVLGEDALDLVNDYIEAKKVVHKNDHALYMQTAGSAEQYQTMVAWAAEAFTPEQKAVFNRQVQSNDRATTLFAIESLKAKYEASNGRAPRLVKGTGAAPAGTKAFSSSAEMTAAMRDPRYKTDPAYREQVAARLAASNF